MSLLSESRSSMLISSTFIIFLELFVRVMSCPVWTVLSLIFRDVVVVCKLFPEVRERIEESKLELSVPCSCSILDLLSLRKVMRDGESKSEEMEDRDIEEEREIMSSLSESSSLEWSVESIHEKFSRSSLSEIIGCCCCLVGRWMVVVNVGDWFNAENVSGIVIVVLVVVKVLVV